MNNPKIYVANMFALEGKTKLARSILLTMPDDPIAKQLLKDIPRSDIFKLSLFITSGFVLLMFHFAILVSGRDAYIAELNLLYRAPAEAILTEICTNGLLRRDLYDDSVVGMRCSEFAIMVTNEDIRRVHVVALCFIESSQVSPSRINYLMIRDCLASSGYFFWLNPTSSSSSSSSD